MNDDADNQSALPPEAATVSDPVISAAQPKKGRGGRIALLALGLAGVVGGGAFAYTQITGG